MEANLVWISFVMAVVAVIGLAFFIIKIGATPASFDFAGIWLNESMNIRILLHDIDSEFQGSVIWANGMDRLLGFKMVENLKFDKSKKGRGNYSDPLTGQRYQINLSMKRKGIIQINAYYPNSESLAFSQEWKQLES